MSQTPPIITNERTADAAHVKALSVLHFIGAGLAFIGLVFLLGLHAFFHALSEAMRTWNTSAPSGPPHGVFAIMKFVYPIIGTWFVASGILNAISGLSLRAKRNRTFSLIVAGVNCLQVPIGTALGVFTIIVLMRDSVQELYENAPKHSL